MHHVLLPQAPDRLHYLDQRPDQRDGARQPCRLRAPYLRSPSVHRSSGIMTGLGHPACQDGVCHARRERRIDVGERRGRGHGGQHPRSALCAARDPVSRRPRFTPA